MQNSGQIQFNPTTDHGPWEVMRRKEEERKRRLLTKVRYETEENEEKMDKLVDSCNQFSFSVNTHMPLDLFPDELTVDIHKVTFIDIRLLSKDVTSIPIKDINKVEVTNDFLFASIEIVNGSQTTHINVSWLWKNEARQIQAIIQGLMVAYQNYIDVEELPQDEILPKLQTLGAPVV